MRSVGIYQQSHRPLLNQWEGEALYEIARRELPYQNARQMATRECILAKLAWAKPTPRVRTLSEVLLEEGERKPDVFRLDHRAVFLLGARASRLACDRPAKGEVRVSGEHTQGDWRVDGQFDSETSVMIVADYPEIGDVVVVEVEPQLDDWSEEEIANVRLMAAAPKLLETAEQFLNHAHDGHDAADGTTIQTCRRKRCVALRRLIAAAKGERD